MSISYNSDEYMTLPHLLQHKVCFYKAAQLLFHEIHPWTVQLKSTGQDESKLIQKHLFIAASTPWNTCDIASPPGQGSKKYRKTLTSKLRFSYFLCFPPLNGQLLIFQLTMWSATVIQRSQYHQGHFRKPKESRISKLTSSCWK